MLGIEEKVSLIKKTLGVFMEAIPNISKGIMMDGVVANKYIVTNCVMAAARVQVEIATGNRDAAPSPEEAEKLFAKEVMVDLTRVVNDMMAALSEKEGADKPNTDKPVDADTAYVDKSKFN